MKHTTLALCLLCALTVLAGVPGPVLAEPERGQASEVEQGAGQVDFEQVVEFDRDLHFLTPDGQDKVVPSGGYFVEAVENGLRLKSADQEEAEAVIVQAELTTHDQSVETPEVLSMKEGDDQRVVMVLLSDGTAMQAVGSTSGIQSRASTLLKRRRPSRGLQFLPQVSKIVTNPIAERAITPSGTLGIKGKFFGTSTGKINVLLNDPIPLTIALSVESWSDNKITAQVPGTITGVKNHNAKIQIVTTAGATNAWSIPFHAKRAEIKLKSDDPAISVEHCSTGADRNFCNHLDASTGGRCFVVVPPYNDASIFAVHRNCDYMVDWDEGEDRFVIILKNGWTFSKVRVMYTYFPTGELDMPQGKALQDGLPGSTSWKAIINWKLPPAEEVKYGYVLWITGPEGVSHF